jgi:hypothetical protein
VAEDWASREKTEMDRLGSMLDGGAIEKTERLGEVSKSIRITA